MFDTLTLPMTAETRRARTSIFGISTHLLAHPLQFIREVQSLRRAEQFAREYKAARLELGERMYAVGIDDGETACLIAAVEDELRAAKAAGHSWEALEAQREELVLRLADAALENDAPLPGADAELRRAWDLKTAGARAGLAVA